MTKGNTAACYHSDVIVDHSTCPVCHAIDCWCLHDAFRPHSCQYTSRGHRRERDVPTAAQFDHEKLHWTHEFGDPVLVNEQGHVALSSTGPRQVAFTLPMDRKNAVLFYTWHYSR